MRENAARDSDVDSTETGFKSLDDFLPAFADFSRASPYDFTHVALTLPLTAGGRTLGLLQTEHSGIGYNPFVNESHVQCKSLLLLHWTTRGLIGCLHPIAALAD